MKLTDLMDREQILRYVQDRLFYPDERAQTQIDTLAGVVEHNAFRSDEVRRTLKKARLDFEEYYPLESSEVHIYVPATKHIHKVNPRDVIRLERDKNLVEALKELGLCINFECTHYNDSAVEATHRFKEFAFDIADNIFKNIPQSEVINQGYINISMGPYSSFDFDNTSILYEKDDDYLNYKLIKINGRLTVAFDFIFANQAEDILDKMLANISSTLPGINVNLFHYGKVGGLNPKNTEKIIELGDICVPIGSLDQQALIEEGDNTIYPIRNEIYIDEGLRKLFESASGKNIHYGNTVDAIPVLKQTRYGHELAMENNGRFLDMEWDKLTVKRNRYPGLGIIKYYFAGAVSDMPLEGKTLAENSGKVHKDSQKIIANIYKNIIKRQ